MHANKYVNKVWMIWKIYEGPLSPCIFLTENYPGRHASVITELNGKSMC